MSGHSKWATIKHKKGATDAKRGKLFAKLARQIEVAAKGGGDVDMNPTLRTAVQKAKSAQMTNEAIDRAVKRGSGNAEGDAYESIMYEGYAPGGAALMIDVLTDNRNRSGADIRQIFSKLGGSMAEPGAVGWQFARKGVIMVDASADEDELMMAALEAGAEDMVQVGEAFQVTSDPSPVYDIKTALETGGFTVQSADSPMMAENLVPVTDVKDAKAILRILEALEDNDDVQDVFSNFDMSDDLMEAAAE
ncbi:MAG: YebC/PmpR family DNA-binding transcriptional regulator [Ilumatobacter sp.]|jgi:YebC/PmpR family DNA-binding regulatory protein|uniref:YebC/PmpR family DNA-binding transcriptional regulator n=1 Tax=Ilumatobacter sp. TaxID=1967498 RepID=UPI001D69EF3E|nr:YebC/PmpR family DNA-binding transcriptional regulator [Ilumatobacter sp.]MBT5275898.1 YebC/PmpR family DNA-binding transcriptional regulator [Ilumatobacter sp.]MBT5553055.1 YebC/PmpR family DNA-binding transcriptional regulator [Ilumatobacter sp.]MBT5864123.1 YebC/PmpR family DNA-binding transcriptional regulator [Ilumatobacter sp.]MDG0976412.1 YebC/PmpR family DNA-binding transcriptional regulator [Ilumatobacter sp.]